MAFTRVLGPLNWLSMLQELGMVSACVLISLRNYLISRRSRLPVSPRYDLFARGTNKRNLGFI